MSVLLSMAAFALASSISPGPVNVVALGSGARYGFRGSLPHVTGATVGFSLLLVLTGLGLNEMLAAWPALTGLIRWAGVAFLLYMAWRLAADSGEIGAGGRERRPSLWQGAAMQWLSPKAWLASIAGMGTYAGQGDSRAVWVFTAIYFVVCYASIASWAGAGALFQGWLRDARRMRLFNRALAALIVLSVAGLVAA